MTTKPKLTDATRDLIRQAREAWALPRDETKVERIQEIVDACPTCDGGGQVQIQVTVPRCCGRAEHECGGRGCTGPEADVDVDVDACPDCGGSGLILAVPEQETK